MTVQNPTSHLTIETNSQGEKMWWIIPNKKNWSVVHNGTQEATTHSFTTAKKAVAVIRSRIVPN